MGVAVVLAAAVVAVVAALGQQLLRVRADHERREQLRGVRMRRALDDRGGRGDDEGSVLRIDDGDRMALRPRLDGVGHGRAGGDRTLAPLDHVERLLVALDDHRVVFPQLLVEVPAALLRHHRHDAELERREGRIRHHEFALVLGVGKRAPGLRHLVFRHDIGAAVDGDRVDALRDPISLRVAQRRRDLVDALGLERHEGSLRRHLGHRRRVGGGQEIGRDGAGRFLLHEPAEDRRPAGAE